MSLEFLRSKTQTLFPVRGAQVALEAGECRVGDDGFLLLTVRLITYDGEMIRDVVELPRERVETLMPHDLSHPDVIKLKRAQTAEDFAAAFLKGNRLGGLLS